MALRLEEKTGGGSPAFALHPSGAPWCVALLSAAIGTVFGWSLTPGHDPQISFGAALILSLIIAVLSLKRAVVRTDVAQTAAEASRSAFFEHAIEGIFRTTVDGQYLDANPALARIYGYDDVQSLIEGLTDIAGQLYVDPERRGAFQALMRENDAVVDFVSEIRRRDGSTIWISENARAVRNWTGKIVFYEGTVEDVTEKIEAQEAMRRALHQTEEASRAKTAFLAAMSHELKTPLNAVLGFSEILKEELLGPLGQPSYRNYAADIHASGTHLLAIINDILDVVRVQTKAITLDRRDVSIAEVVHASLASVRRETQDERPVGIDIAAVSQALCVDKQRFGQALCKILSNALKFTPDKGAVRIAARPLASGGIAIDIIDEGIGMEPETIAMALEPFGQVDRSLARRFEGTGLGLTIARALIDLHGGELSIASEKGHGTTVTIALPAEAMGKSTLSPEYRAAG